MGQINTREFVLLNSQTLTTSGSAAVLNIPQGWQAAIISLVGATISGTSPTWNFFLQRQLGQAATTDLIGGFPTGTAIFDDLLAFGTMTTNSTRVANLSTGYAPVGTANATTLTTADWAQSDAALTQASLRFGPIGGAWRVKWTVSGTTPSGVFQMQAQMIPYGT